MGGAGDAGRTMKAVVFTLGCKVNECESDSLIYGLSRMGYEVSDKLEKADVYIVNTCAVTAEAEKKSRQTVSRINKLNSEAPIIFTGCASQKNPQAFIDKPNVRLVTGTYAKNDILLALNGADVNVCGIHISEHGKHFEELLPSKSLRTRTYIKVQDGCDNFCSYCIVPYLRGRSRSRDPEKVIGEIERLAPREAVINGINLSAYDYGGRGLSGLIEMLGSVDCRIRLGSLEVGVIDDKFLSALGRLKDFAEHFHLSLQSGSDSVLKDMNRRYTAEEYLEKVRLIRSYFPDAGITTDIIAGFPTESDKDFENTLAVIDQAAFSDIHPFTFSMRSGTSAYSMKDLPHDIKKKRLVKLLEKKTQCKAAFIAAQCGKIQRFLCEEFTDGFFEGYSGNYIRLYAKDRISVGEMRRAEIVSPFKDGALVRIVD